MADKENTPTTGTDALNAANVAADVFIGFGNKIQTIVCDLEIRVEVTAQRVIQPYMAQITGQIVAQMRAEMNKMREVAAQRNWGCPDPDSADALIVPWEE